MSKYREIAVGWLKKSETRGEYVSAIMAKGNATKGKPGVTNITVTFDNGETMEVKGFAMFFNENKKPESRAPDVTFVTSQEN